MNTRIIIARLHDSLSASDFFKKGSTWNRQWGDFVEVISLQRSKDGEAMTLNAGVGHRHLYWLFWRKELGPFVDEPSCVVRTRIGQLLDGKDLWWEMSSPGVEDDMVAKVHSHLLPFLMDMRSLNSMERFLVASQATDNPYPLPVVYLAIIKHELGFRSAACDLLANRRLKAPSAWRARIDGVMQRLSCI
jgi:hypothetical protein